MSLLRFADLGVGYGGRPVLAGIDLAVAAGEVVALVGRSGSGKSTLAAAAIGLLPPATRLTGRVLLAGRDVTTLAEREWRPLRGAQVAAVFQEPALALNPARRIGGQIAEGAAAHRRLDRAGTAALVARLLAEVGLDVPADRFPGELSGGQRQRVAIAAALAADPKLLLADEPTAALDPAARAGILALLVRLARRRGMGVLLISHDLALVAGAADRVAVLDGGRLVETGPVATALAAPHSPRLRALVAADAPAAPPPPPRAGPPLLTLAGVARRFGHGTVGLTGIDLAIRPGETVALLGASGAGKTTLARLVLGLDRPDAGEVRLAGFARGPRDRHPPRGWAGLVQAVFQDPAESLDPRWTIGRSVAEPVRRSPDRAALVADALARVGLPAAVAGRRPAALSGGERQRAALARALVRQPQLLVLDEALSALDPELRAELAGLLLRLQQAHGLAYLLVTHDHRLAGRLAHRALVLAAGQVVADGSAAALLAAQPV